MFGDTGQFSLSDMQKHLGVFIVIEPSLLGMPEEMRWMPVVQVAAIGGRLLQPAYRAIAPVEGSNDLYRGGKIFHAPSQSSQHRSALLEFYPLDTNLHQQLECGQNVTLKGLTESYMQLCHEMDLLANPKLLSDGEARHWVNAMKQLWVLNGIESQNSFYGREHGYKIEVELTRAKGIVIRLAQSTGYLWVDELKLDEHYATPEEMAEAYDLDMA